MHGDLTLTGPLFVALVAFMYACAGLALFVAIDPLRARRAASFEKHPAARWYWSLPQAVYFLLFVSGNIPGLTVPVLASTFVIATPFIFAAQIAYLLRVVYPSPKRTAEQAMEQTLREAGRTARPDTDPE